MTVETVDERQPIYGYETTTNVVSVDHLIGKIFTHLELLGLTDRQLSALKKTLRQMVWEWYNSHLENEMGFADPSHSARVEAGLEPLTTSTSGAVYTVSYRGTSSTS